MDHQISGFHTGPPIQAHGCSVLSLNDIHVAGCSCGSCGATQDLERFEFCKRV